MASQAHLGPSWRHLGPILAPSSAILPQFWASRACPKLAKIGQDSLQDFSCQDRFQNLLNPLQTSIFIISGPILGHIFNNFPKTFWKDSVSNFKASHKISLGTSSDAGGGGTRPQGVFDRVGKLELAGLDTKFTHARPGGRRISSALRAPSRQRAEPAARN